MKHIVVMMLLAGTLVGCAANPASPWLVQRENSKPKSCEPLTSDQELVLGMSQEMASTGRLHAALANLERLPAQLPEARLRKAQMLRVLGRGEAEQLYADLVNTCLASDAHHGLGQVEVARKNYPKALHHLRIATSLSPANDAMRNDLGVTYLNMQRIPEAHFELMTAMELNETDTRAIQNMLTLLIYQDKWNHARDLVTRKKLTTDQFRDAEKRATALKAEHAANLASAKGSGRVPPSRAVEQIQPQKAVVKSAAFVPVQQPVSRPVVVKPAPVAVRPAPMAVQPPPAAVRAAPVATQPRPVSVRPAPVAVQPSPAAVRPAPTRAVQQATPAAVRPSPIPVKPSSAAARPSPVAGQPPAIYRPIRATVQPSQPAASAATDGAIRGVKRAPTSGSRLIEPITGY